MLRRYRLYTCVKAALALPAGPKRVEASHAALIDGDGKHCGGFGRHDLVA